MSQRHLGGFITANPTAPTLSSASGVWTLEQQFQNSANWPKTAEPVSRSVRTRSSAPAYFTRTPAAASNRRVWTWSGWVKRGSLAATQVFFGALQNATTGIGIGFQSTNTFFYSINGVGNSETTAVFRDPSAWYHVVFAFDSTQATAANRAKVYINGVNLAFTSTIAVQNNYYDVNNNIAQYLGQNGQSTQYFDGYLAEVNFIDGQALDASYFGFTDANGVWQPAAYSGSYGTNGFYLGFSDNSGVTATTLGKDNSGNGNNWTPTNISITAGTTYDSMLDVPANYADGGNGRGNYPVWNVLKRYTNNMAFANGNLTVSDAGTTATGASATMRSPASGKWYWEVTATTISGALGSVLTTTEANADTTAFAGNLGYYRSSGAIANLVGTLQTSGATYTSGDVIGVAVDIDNGTVQFYKNGVAQGATPSFTFTAGTVIVPAISTDNAAGTKVFAGNFGQQPFAYTPPTGFIALNTQNLPTPSISSGANYMATTLWTGAGQTGAGSITGVGFQPDFVWSKARSFVSSNALYNSIVGGGASKGLSSDLTASEASFNDNATNGYLSSFDSNGFSYFGGSTPGYFSANAATYVAWSWKAGGTAVSNTAGSITSSVSANTAAGVSVVTYTSTGANATVGHGLGVAPSMIIVKNRASATTNWPVYHKALTAGGSLFLNSTAVYTADTTMWQNTAPTSTVFSVGTNANLVSGATIAYCFAEVTGFSKFGTYANNNSTDGAFIYLGFRPKFLLVKCTDATEAWYIEDSSRQTYNYGPSNTNFLLPNLSNAEQGGQTAATAGIDFLSNGFKIRTTNAASGEIGFGTRNYVFMAFAENPFKNSRAR